MGFYNVIYASDEQIQTLYDKHCKDIVKTKLFGRQIKISSVISGYFSYDHEDSIGFVSLSLMSGKKVSYQLRGDEPCFVEFTGFGSTRYEIPYPNQRLKELYDFLKVQGIKTRDAFWKGSQI